MTVVGIIAFQKILQIFIIQGIALTDPKTARDADQLRRKGNRTAYPLNPPPAGVGYASLIRHYY